MSRLRWLASGGAVAVIAAAVYVLSWSSPASMMPSPDRVSTMSPDATSLAAVPTAAPLTLLTPLTPAASVAPVAPVAPAAPVASTATPSSSPAPTPAPAPAQPEPAATENTAAAPAATEHTVQTGDTLLSIALANGVSMAAIQLANDMGESQIVRLGQALKIPQTKLSPDENTFWVVHVVQPGETLVGISASYGALLDDLIRVNQLPDASVLSVDQALILPVVGFIQPAQVVAQAEQPAARVESAPRSESAPSQPDPPAPAAPDAEPVAVPLPTPDAVVAAPDEASLAAAAQAQPESAGDEDVFRQQLYELHNQARISAGLGPLAWSPVLQQAAQLHAQDSAARGFGSHSGSDGSTSRLRIARAGYAGNVTGENWAFATSADRAFDMWFTREYPSGPHRNNILSPRYTEVGFGVAPAGNGGYYVIANFGAP